MPATPGRAATTAIHRRPFAPPGAPEPTAAPLTLLFEFWSTLADVGDPGQVELRREGSIAEAARGGTVDGLVDGWWSYFFVCSNPKSPFATLTVDPAGKVFALLRGARAGADGDYISAYTPDGAKSVHGPIPTTDFDGGAEAPSTWCSAP